MNKLFIIISCAAILLTGCRDNESGHKHEGDSHSHSHAGTHSKYSNLEPLAYTLYSENYELFVEFKPLVVGETSRFAAHFTKLGEKFEAVVDGEVIVTLVNDVKQTSKNPSSPGIFRLQLTPHKTGVSNLRFDISSEEITESIIIEDLMVFSNVKEVSKSNVETEEIDEIVYLKEQAWKIEFANQEVLAKPFSELIKTTGQIKSAQGDEVVITAKSSGIVSLGGNKKQIGSSINEGETLLTISGGNLTENNLNSKYLETKSRFEKTSADYNRAKELEKDNIISQKEFQEIQLAFEQAQIEFNTISKNYSKNGQRITSPIKGFIKNLLVSEGQFVEVGEPIAQVSQNRRLMLTSEVPQKHFGKLNSIMSANFKTAYNDKVYNTDSLNGTLVSFGKNVNEGGYYTPLNFEIDNKGDLISGSYIEIFLKTNAQKEELTIPLSALIEEQGTYYVYVQTSGEGFQKREIRIGASDGKNVVVLSGIEEHERVVTKGAYQIKLATMSGAIPAHGHEH